MAALVPLVDDHLLIMGAPIQGTQQPTAAGAHADLLQAAFQIHRGPAQYLAIALMKLRLCDRYISEDVSRAQAILRESLEGVQTALDAVRTTIDMLRSPRVTSGDAVEWTLRAMVERLRSTGTVRFFEDLEDVGPLPHDVALGLSEIACEALTNAAKHAAARHITIGLHKRRNEIILEVTDDGKRSRWPRAGRGRRGQGAGVALMQERARRLGWSFTIESAVPIGTLVRAVVRVP
jgi:signal transduction histidine kinase